MLSWSRCGGPGGGLRQNGHREPGTRGCCHGRAAAGPAVACDRMGTVSQTRADVVILGGGPGGYEAALVAAQLGAQVTVVEADGLGGACVLTDCVPSKTLIATSETMGILGGAAGLGIRIEGHDGRMRPRPGAPAGPVTVDAARLNGRVKALAVAQSADVAARLAVEGVEVIAGWGRLASPHTVVADGREISAGVVLLATGGMPRKLPGEIGRASCRERV